MPVSDDHTVDALVSAALRGELTDAQARRLARQGVEIVTLALLAAGKRIAEQEARIAERSTRIRRSGCGVSRTRRCVTT